MKGFILNLGLLALAVSSVTTFASVSDCSPSASTRFAYWNPVTVYNDAPYDIQYSFASRSGANSYFLPKGRSDVYHSGIGDSYAQIVVDACTERTKDGACINVVTHVSPVFYNLGLVKDVHILTVASLKVTCLDGGIVSCVVK